MATYAVGDIQGCLPSLLTLLETINFQTEDSLWAAGDLVNRGPQSLDTLRFFYNMGDRAKIVLGNHDLHLLACWHGARKVGRNDTFDEILQADDAEELMHWLQHQPLLHRDKNLGYTMVHAGIPPLWNITFAKARAKEVHKILRSEHAPIFFQNMYGNEPANWDNSLSDFMRLRVITNYLTRMRFCTAEGELEFKSKGEPDSPPEGFRPWYEHPHQCAKENILFGHWAAMMGETGQKKFTGLDTGCVWGGKLSAIRLDDGARFSADCCDLNTA